MADEFKRLQDSIILEQKGKLDSSRRVHEEEMEVMQNKSSVNIRSLQQEMQEKQEKSHQTHLQQIEKKHSDAQNQLLALHEKY